MKKLAFAAFVFAMFGLLSTVSAADKDGPVGNWKWKSKFGKNETERTMKIESVKDGKVTGTVSGFGKDAKDNKIEDGTFKDGELSFSVTVMRKDQKFTTKYNGKVSGDSI